MCPRFTVDADADFHFIISQFKARFSSSRDRARFNGHPHGADIGDDLFSDGFDFLGQNIRKYNGKLLIKPSKNAIKSFLKKVRTIVRENKTATQDLLIRKLNPVIRGWVNYHRYVVSADIFGLVDHRIFECLWRWACRRHKRKGR